MQERSITDLAYSDNAIPSGAVVRWDRKSSTASPWRWRIHVSPAGWRGADRSLDILEALLRFRFLPESRLLVIGGGNEDETRQCLHTLKEAKIINDAVFTDRGQSEIRYYLYDKRALDLLAAFRGLDVRESMIEEVEGHRRKYAELGRRGPLRSLPLHS